MVLIEAACTRYQEYFRRLAAGSREVGFWANATDHLATRLMIGELSTGLAGIEATLREMTAGGEPDDRRAGLARAYRAALQRPILASGDLSAGLRMPALAAAYINPEFRAARIEAAAEPASESWWQQHPSRQDIQSFLLGYLTLPEATTAPLIVLGHPGAGKSVLTRILSARLPPSEFLVVRVVLREVAAESDVQAQTEAAVRAITGENLSWPALVRTAGDALPLIVLDGFDELLQATATAQSDYLQRIADFQQREADQGRPTAVIVTSRTAVADRAAYPAGATAVRLEPFDKGRITRWLEIWNDTNDGYLTEHNLRPLTTAAVLAYPQLAAQPLLLLLLALHDAEGNALADGQAQLSQCDLYEQLLSRFAAREVAKAGIPLPPDEEGGQTEHELTQLGLAAFAMFNRGRQWVTENELDADLAAVLIQDGAAPTHGLRKALTLGALIIGRFFFVHVARATQDGQERRTYEFLHATFGEYLIARLITRELADMIAMDDVAGRRGRRPPMAADQLLRPLLSCASLTTRRPVMTFLSDLLAAQFTPAQRDGGQRLLLRSLSQALEPRSDAGATYPPLPLSAPARHACYTVNLVLLLIAITGKARVRELFPPPADPLDTWRRHAQLWRSQLSADGWASLADAVAAERTWADGKPDLELTLTREIGQPVRLDPRWILAQKINNSYPGSARWLHTYAQAFIRQSQFAADPVDDHFTHALEPLTYQFASSIATFTASSDTGRPASAANALIRIWLKSGQRAGPHELAAAYDDGLAICSIPATWDAITNDRYLFIIIRQLAADAHHLPQPWLAATLTRIASLQPDTGAWIRETFEAQHAAHFLPQLPQPSA